MSTRNFDQEAIKELTELFRSTFESLYSPSEIDQLVNKCINDVGIAGGTSEYGEPRKNPRLHSKQSTVNRQEQIA